VAEIDLLNVYWAAMLARQRAVEALVLAPAHVLVDGKRRITGLKLPQTPIVEGDRLHPSISATSTRPTPIATADSRMASNRIARRFALNSLESFRPSSEILRGRITAAAITGPAQAPTPTSSTPATSKMPLAINPARIMALAATASAFSTTTQGYFYRMLRNFKISNGLDTCHAQQHSSPSPGRGQNVARWLAFGVPADSLYSTLVAAGCNRAYEYWAWRLPSFAAAR
jgi:hypothetical protein